MRQKYFKRKNKQPKNFSILTANQKVNVANQQISEKSKLNEINQYHDLSEEFYKENFEENKHSVSQQRYFLKKIRFVFKEEEEIYIKRIQLYCQYFY